MDILFLLIPLSLALVFVIGAVFWLALRGGQFEDLESPGLDVVLDDDMTSAPKRLGEGTDTSDAQEGDR